MKQQERKQTMCKENCKCAKKDVQGKASSLTSIAFNTGVMLEQKRIIALLQDWFDFDADLSKGIEPLIALIKEENTND